jgi:hypothetical protein
MRPSAIVLLLLLGACGPGPGEAVPGADAGPSTDARTGLDAGAADTSATVDAPPPLDASLRDTVVGTDDTSEPAASPDGPTFVLSGPGYLETVDPDGSTHSTLALTLTNSGAETVSLTRSPMFGLTRGGFAYFLGDAVSESGGRFFSAGGPFPPGTHATVHLVWNTEAPLTHWLFRLDPAEPDVPPVLKAFTLQRAGYQEPPDEMIDDVFIGLIEPVEVIPLATGQKFITLTGRTINTTGKPLTETRFSIRLTDYQRAQVFDSDQTSTSHITENSNAVLPLIYGFIVPSTFMGGTVTLTATATLGGRPRTITHSAEVIVVQPESVRPPVQGLWRWGNGPGELRFDQPNQFRPARRYGYDFTKLADVGGTRQSSTGDPVKNESYFAFGQPFAAIVDGVVIALADDAPDHLGNAANSANQKRVNRLVIQRDLNTFIVYEGLRQGSATVKLGQTVKAGDLLGQVGNNANVSEPHLHVAAYVLNFNGRPQAVPLAFTGLRLPPATPAIGVPKGGVEYLTGP